MEHLLGHRAGWPQPVYQDASNRLAFRTQAHPRHTDINLAQAWGRPASSDDAEGSGCEAEHDFMVTDTQAEDAIHPSAEANIRAGVAYYEHLWRVAMPQAIRHSMPVCAELRAGSHRMHHAAPCTLLPNAMLVSTGTACSSKCRRPHACQMAAAVPATTSCPARVCVGVCPPWPSTTVAR